MILLGFLSELTLCTGDGLHGLVTAIISHPGLTLSCDWKAN